MRDIAIIGMAARFPGARNVATFWNNICSGIDSVREVPEAELVRVGVDPSGARRNTYVRRAAFPDDVEFFDSRLFEILPTEAAILDPQHRVLLECGLEALEDAGQDPDRYAGSIAVFAGCTLNTYLLTHLMTHPALIEKIGPLQLNISSSPDFLATRISYKLGLHGVSHTVQCACSTSLVAVHLACQSLLSGDADMALAGGASLNFYLRNGYSYLPGGMFSETGICRPFDSRADGTVFGSGAGLVVLKRYDDARRDRNHIHAIIKGSAVNNDGSTKVGYTAPSIEGQSKAIAEALANARVPANTIKYVETHGTGTPIGDPIEFQALLRAYGSQGHDGPPCFIGSVKSNIGHLDCASGIAGLIKAVEILKHGCIPPTLHFEAPNSLISLDSTRFQINTHTISWPDPDLPRRASVSSFGVGGTNAHLVLESAEYAERRPSEFDSPFHLMVHSAATDTALAAAVSQQNAHLTADPELDLRDAAFTLALGRKERPWRTFQILRATDDGHRLVRAAREPMKVSSGTHPSVIFLFSGQGSQTIEMGRELYRWEPTFRRVLDENLAQLAQYMDYDPRGPSWLEHTKDEIQPIFQRTDCVQPIMFAFEHALATLWMSWGIEPSLMIGHSLGEYTAACIAGTMSVEDALKLVALRGRLMQATAPGAMLVVPLGEAEASAMANDQISLAAVNSHTQCVMSGARDQIGALEARLAADGVNARRLPVQQAFHSVLMEPILDEFRKHLDQVRLATPQRTWLSNVTGKIITPEQAIDPAYWLRHLRYTVRFYDNLREAHQTPDAIFLEVGPQRTLQQLANRLPLSSRNQIAIASVESAETEHLSLISALATFWMRGVGINWQAFYQGQDCYRIPLPTYPFERQRCWIERAAQAEVPLSNDHASDTCHPEESKRAPQANNRPDMPNAYVQPVTPTEVSLTKILEAALGITPLGSKDNLFNLGVDSLMAINLVSQFREQFGVLLTAVDLYEAIDIASLARIVDEMVDEQRSSSQVPPASSSKIEHPQVY